MELKQHLIEQVKYFKEDEHPEWYPTEQYICQINILNILLFNWNYFFSQNKGDSDAVCDNKERD